MTQLAHPTSTVQAWATGNHLDIDETIADDNDKTVSDTAPANDVAVFKFGSLSDPVSSSGHILHYRIQKDSASGKQIDVTAQLRQAYINEGSQGTLIVSFTHTNVANGWTTYDQTLSGGQADSITDYTNLYFRIVANQP